MDQIEFGLFDWVDRGQRPLHQLYEERLQLIEVADVAGFYSYHLAEHHATPLGMAPSPALFLTAAAQRTHKIRIGPLGCILPLYPPLRLIEEICMLDNLSNGRLDLGVARGVSPYELRFSGIDHNDSRAIFDESMAIIVEGLTRPRLNFQGSYFNFDNVPMEMEPYQKPYPPLWYPTNNADSIPYVAKNGYHFVDLGPAARVREHVDLYWNLWEEHRLKPNRLNGHVTEPKVGIMRQIVVAETDKEADTAARTAHQDWFDSITKLWHEYDDHMPDALFNWDTSIQNETIIHGSPSRVKEQIGRMFEVSGCNYLICAFAWGTMSHEQSLNSLRLFVDEVMADFRDNPRAIID